LILGRNRQRGVVMKDRFVPDAGDLVWVNFTASAGHEQAGRRPALVLSPIAYNRRTSLMICCAMITRIKGYPFEVVIDGSLPSAVIGRSDQDAGLARSQDHKEGAGFSG
jgi:mRNA interferase MazF